MGDMAGGCLGGVLGRNGHVGVAEEGEGGRRRGKRGRCKRVEGGCPWSSEKQAKVREMVCHWAWQ